MMRREERGCQRSQAGFSSATGSLSPSARRAPRIASCQSCSSRQVPCWMGRRSPTPLSIALRQARRASVGVGGGVVCVCMVSFWFGVVLGLPAAPTESFRGTLRKVCERCGVCGGKTGLTIQIQNGWQDFRFREKFLEREETGKRFQVENQGFRGVQVWKGALS